MNALLTSSTLFCHVFLLPTSLAAQASWQVIDLPRISRHSMVYDAHRDRIVVFGGLRGILTTTQKSTWEWDGKLWRQRKSPQSPPSTTWPPMIYDPVRKVTMLFAGDTWTWDGIEWRKIPGATGPKLAGFPVMTYDSRRQVAVLVANGQTWEYGVKGWIDKKVPSPKVSFRAMAYDASRGVSALVGLSATSSPRLGECWEWNGVKWTATHSRTNQVPDLKNFALTYDAAAKRLLLVGGEYNYSTRYSSDLWQRIGTKWSKAGRWSLGQSPAITFDSKRLRTVAFGGVRCWHRLCSSKRALYPYLQLFRH